MHFAMRVVMYEWVVAGSDGGGQADTMDMLVAYNAAYAISIQRHCPTQPAQVSAAAAAAAAHVMSTPPSTANGTSTAVRWI